MGMLEVSLSIGDESHRARSVYCTYIHVTILKIRQRDQWAVPHEVERRHWHQDPGIRTMVAKKSSYKNASCSICVYDVFPSAQLLLHV